MDTYTICYDETKRTSAGMSLLGALTCMGKWAACRIEVGMSVVSLTDVCYADHLAVLECYNGTDVTRIYVKKA